MELFVNDNCYILFAPKFGSTVVKTLNPESIDLLQYRILDKEEVWETMLVDSSRPIILNYRHPDSWFRSAITQAVLGIIQKEELGKLIFNVCNVNLKLDLHPYDNLGFYYRNRHILMNLPHFDLLKVLQFVIDNFGLNILNDGHLSSNYYHDVLKFLMFASKHHRSSLPRIHILNISNSNFTHEDTLMLRELKILKEDVDKLEEDRHSNSKFYPAIDTILTKTIETMLPVDEPFTNPSFAHRRYARGYSKLIESNFDYLFFDLIRIKDNIERGNSLKQSTEIENP